MLVVPTLAALASEPDVLVVVTAGGRSSATIPGPIPDNARLADYLPLDWLFPKVDAIVTNGGYGTVNQALSYGIPIVGAGASEDKPDVNARVAWSGVGIDLQTNTPVPEALRAAVRNVLDEPGTGCGPTYSQPSSQPWTRPQKSSQSLVTSPALLQRRTDQFHPRNPGSAASRPGVHAPGLVA